MKLHVQILHEGSVIFDKYFTKFPVSLGRHSSNDIALKGYHWVSRKHAHIEWEDGQLILKDMGSSNGLIVDGKKESSVLIKDGQVVEICALQVIFATQFNPDEISDVADNPKFQEELTEIMDITGTTDIGSIIRVSQESMEKEAGEASQPQVTKTTDTNPHRNSTALINSTQQTQKSHQVDSNSVEDRASHIVNPEKEELSVKDHISNFKAKKVQPPAIKNQRKHIPIGKFSEVFKKPHKNIHSLSKTQTNLEVTIIWRGQIYQSQLFQPGEPIKIGLSPQSIYLPILSCEYHLADYDGNYTYCYPPDGCEGEYITGESKSQSLQEICSALPRKKGRNQLKIDLGDTCVISVTKDVKVCLQYIEAPRQLTKNRVILPEQLFRKTITGSGLGHIIAVLFIFFLKPSEPDIKIRNLPPRVAKLLVQKPKPKPKPKPQLKPKLEEKVAKKPVKVKKKKVRVVKKKRIRKPRKVVVKKSRRIKRLNEKIIRTTIRKKRNIKSLGILAALGRTNLNKKAISTPIALDITPKVGRTSSKINTRSVIGALKKGRSPLPTEVRGGLKTKGKAYGTGTGYGVQGLKGSAGSRGIAAIFQGQPELLKVKQSEGLTKKQVMDELKRHVSKIQSCYERALLNSPGISGRVEYEWHITAKGRVKWSKVKRAEISNGDVLNNCVLRVIKKMRFPVAKNGEPTVPHIGFPFGRL